MSNQTNVGRGLFENLRRKMCLQCGSGNLSPLFAIEQETRPSLEYWHTIIAACRDCRKGQLERTYRDISDPAEAFDQSEWFLLDELSMEQLRGYIERGDTIEKKIDRCPEPLSPKCLCSVHWILIEASKRLEPLSDAELQRFEGVAHIIFSSVEKGFPSFTRQEAL